MQFQEKSRINTSLLTKVNFIAHNETVHYCILIHLVFFSVHIADNRLKHASAFQKRNKSTFILLYSDTRFLKGPKMLKKKMQRQDTFSDQFDYLCQQQVTSFFWFEKLVSR